MTPLEDRDQRRLTRRRFVAGTVAVGTAAAVPGAAHAAPRSEARSGRRSRTVDVVVVGAGFAGLTAARHIAKAGHFDTRGGAQMSRIVGGSQVIASKMLAELGDAVALNSAVRRIRQSRAGVIVESDPFTVRAKRVIVAIAPTLAGRIDYEPILPFQRDQLTQRFGQGTLTKVPAVYDTPFWRDAGLSGGALATGGPVSLAYDQSPPGGRPGVAFGFVGGDYARRYALMSRSRRRAAVLAQFASFYGPRAKRPRDFIETNWSGEQWTRGCPVGIRGWGRCWPTVRACGSPWIGSTGPGPRRRPIGTGIWMAP